MKRNFIIKLISRVLGLLIGVCKSETYEVRDMSIKSNSITKEVVEEYAERCKNDITKKREHSGKNEYLVFGLIRAIIDYGVIYKGVDVYYKDEWKVSDVYVFKVVDTLYLVALDLGVLFSARNSKIDKCLDDLNSKSVLVTNDIKVVGHRHNNQSGYSYSCSYYTRVMFNVMKSKPIYLRAHLLILILGQATKEDMKLYANTYYNGEVDMVVNHIKMSDTMDYFKDMYLNARDNLELVVKKLNNTYAEDDCPINSKDRNADDFFKDIHLYKEYKNGSAYIGSDGCLYLNDRMLLRYDMLPSVVNC